PGLPPNSSQGPLPSPRFRHRPLHFDTSSAVRWCSSLQISPDGVYPAFSCDAHHQRSERQQLAVVWSLRLIAGSEGPTLISLAAPHLLCSWCARGTRSVSVCIVRVERAFRAASSISLESEPRRGGTGRARICRTRIFRGRFNAGLKARSTLRPFHMTPKLRHYPRSCSPRFASSLRYDFDHLH